MTGERVVTARGGFNPTWQRHVAAYALAEPYLPGGLIADIGCGVGHSYRLLAPRETVGIDVDAEALRGQERRTVAADMRVLPFATRRVRRRDRGALDRTRAGPRAGPLRDGRAC